LVIGQFEESSESGEPKTLPLINADDTDQKRIIRIYGDERGSALPDALAPRRVFIRVLALPPLQIVQVAAEGEWSAFHGGNGKPIMHGAGALVADAGAYGLGRNGAMPGDAAVALVIHSRSIDRADGSGRARVPVLAVGPVIVENGNATNFAEGGLALVRRRVAPDAAIATVEAAGAAVVRPAIGHGMIPWEELTTRETLPLMNADDTDLKIW